jgi:hypothetical protein
MTKAHFKIMAKRRVKIARFPRDFFFRGRLLDWVLSKATDENSSLNKAAELYDDRTILFQYFNWLVSLEHFLTVN